MKCCGWLSLVLLSCLQAIFPAAANSAEPARAAAVSVPEKGARVAIVIGNGNYPSGALANPKNDATAMAASFKKLGFIVELKLDATKADMDAVFKRFSSKAETAGVAALFYAGHGVQVNGSNYLVPIDARPQSERDLKREMIKMDDVIDDMGGAKVKLVFFDACRDNPLSRSFSRGGSRGMAAPVEATGTLISFATKHGNTAADGDGRHSPYTTALLTALESPGGVEIEQMLRRVQQGVRAATNGQQEPWRYGSLDGEFYFQALAPRADNAKLQQEAVDRAVQEAMKRASEQAARDASHRAGDQPGREREASSTTVELAFWDSIKNSSNVDDLQEYLASYPQGRFAGLVRNRIRALGAAPPQASAGPAPQAAAESARAGAQAPTQVALIVPEQPVPVAASSAVSSSSLPQTGDVWTYRYVNGWKKDSPQTVIVKVEESESGRVTDRMSLPGGSVADQRTYEGKPDAAERSLGRDVRIIELLPYAQRLLLDGLISGQEKDLANLALGGETYRIKAKLIGRDKIIVPAGTFDAWRVQIAGENLAHLGLNSLVVKAFTHSLWFVPEIRRVVKFEHKSVSNRSSRLDDDSSELVSFTLR